MENIELSINELKEFFVTPISESEKEIINLRMSNLKIEIKEVEYNKIASFIDILFYKTDGQIKAKITIKKNKDSKNYELSFENFSDKFEESLQSTILQNKKEIIYNSYLLAVKDKINSYIYYVIDELKNKSEDGYSIYNTTYIDLKNFAFKVPVLIEGDRGSGKTYDAYAFSFYKGIDPIFIGGHSGIESIDLLGYLIPASSNIETENNNSNFNTNSYEYNNNYETKNKLVWKDGPLTESIRRAKNSKTILIIDELLRIPNKELNILLSTLTPIKGEYHLRTGRLLKVENGIGIEEVISCPTENLFVIATTNSGSQFTVDVIDPALAERFIIIRKDTTEEILNDILIMKILEKKFSITLLQKLIKFYEAMNNGLTQELIEAAPTLRTLSRAIDLAKKEEDVETLLHKQIYLWCGRDMAGLPIDEQVVFIKKAIKVCFS